MSAQIAHHILMIDDDREDAFLMRRALKAIDASIAFDHVIDSEVFVNSLASDSDDYGSANVLLVDLNMRGVDGFGVIKAARAHRCFKHTKITMLTSSDREEDRCRALELGADHFETKPNTIEDMSALASRLVNQK